MPDRSSPPSAANLHHEARAVAEAAARDVAGLIRARAGTIRASGIEAKGLHDLVTEVDRAAQERLVTHLTDAFPTFDVLAEEGTDVEAVRPRADGYRWVVDPIDGTTNFIHGLPPYAVSIALQRETEVVVGVVLDVAHDQCYSAVRGDGLRLDGARAGVSPTRDLEDGLLATGFPYRRLAHVEAYLEVLGRFMRTTRGLRRHGSASVDLARVACGAFDAFFETGLDPWDVAAGVLLVEEGGGRVTDYRGEAGMVFGHQIVATNGHLHAAVLEVLASMRDVRD